VPSGGATFPIALDQVRGMTSSGSRILSTDPMGKP
jgi:hypothetical protein